MACQSRRVQKKIKDFKEIKTKTLCWDLDSNYQYGPKSSMMKKHWDPVKKTWSTAVESVFKSDKHVQAKIYLYETAARLKVTGCLIYF